MDTYYIITTNDQSVPENERGDLIRGHWNYKNNVWKIDKWSMHDNHGRESIAIRRSFEEKLEHLLYSVVNRRSEIDTPEEANEAAKPILDVIKKYTPEFEGFEWPVHNSDSELYIHDLRTEIWLKDDILIHSDEYDDSVFAWLKRHNISIDDFLFNKRYFVMKAGYDAYQDIKTMLNNGIIDKTSITNIDELESDEKGSD